MDTRVCWNDTVTFTVSTFWPFSSFFHHLVSSLYIFPSSFTTFTSSFPPMWRSSLDAFGRHFFLFWAIFLSHAHPEDPRSRCPLSQCNTVTGNVMNFYLELQTCAGLGIWKGGGHTALIFLINVSTMCCSLLSVFLKHKVQGLLTYVWIPTAVFSWSHRLLDGFWIMNHDLQLSCF